MISTEYARLPRSDPPHALDASGLNGCQMTMDEPKLASVVFDGV
jgi:hypothetical protein